MLKKPTPPHRRATPFLAPPLWSQLPATDAVFARDGRRLQATEDVLFLAQVIARAAGRPLLRETRDAEKRWCYTPADGAMADGTPGFVKLGSIRRKLRLRFWRLRSLIGTREVVCELSVDGRKLRDSKRWTAGQPWKLGASLRWPFTKAGDPLLEKLHEIPLMSDASLEGWTPEQTVPKGSILCPLDGIVTPIIGSMRTSPESWQALCGREWQVILCPHCLGEFCEQLTLMN